MKTSGDRLKALLQEYNLTAADFAAHRDVTPQHVHNWFKRGVPLARLDEFAQLLSVNRRWLLSGQGRKHPRLVQPAPGLSHPQRPPPPSPELVAQDAEIVRLPHQTVCEGKLQPTPERFLALPRPLLDAQGVDLAQAICLTLPGNNLQPRLAAGATLAVDRRQARIVDGGLYALFHLGLLRVHLVTLDRDNVLCLHNHDADEYPSEYYSLTQRRIHGIEVIGRVFWWSHLDGARQDKT
ncbi:XRE family transcriptional regulator [Pseudomonas entomophila]|uniref:XRE family transcriptional regulator n=1 Tax=Pseudomonas entomophila TaxID=312306 RepID=UPI003EBAD3CD